MESPRPGWNPRSKRVAPFVLRLIAELTEGSSLEANIELVKFNARLGAAIALAAIKKNSHD